MDGGADYNTMYGGADDYTVNGGTRGDSMWGEDGGVDTMNGGDGR